MTYYYKLGNIPHKRHTQFRQKDGSLYHEELIGSCGFSGIQSLLYHIHPPTALKKIVHGKNLDITCESQSLPCHRHLQTMALTEGGDAIEARVPLMLNDNLCISVARPTLPMEYWYRLADGDEIIFIHEGGGIVESQYGILRYRAGDYLTLPAGVLWRIVPDRDRLQRMLVVEARGHVRLPKHYSNERGQFLEASPLCERDIRPPDELITYDERGEFEVRVKARNQITSYFYAYHPLDVVGWDGHLWPFAFNIEDFEPITGRIHQPPPVHQTFEGPGFVLCSFVPRLLDYHPLAIPAPYNHSNVDTDEVIYYVEGKFISRKGIEKGSITLHPRGIPHGPHPGMYDGSISRERTDELAVMIDTFHPLHLTENAAFMEDKDYRYSWLA